MTYSPPPPEKITPKNYIALSFIQGFTPDDLAMFLERISEGESLSDIPMFLREAARRLRLRDFEPGEDPMLRAYMKEYNPNEMPSSFYMDDEAS